MIYIPVFTETMNQGHINAEGLNVNIFGLRHYRTLCDFFVDNADYEVEK